MSINLAKKSISFESIPGRPVRWLTFHLNERRKNSIRNCIINTTNIDTLWPKGLPADRPLRKTSCSTWWQQHPSTMPLLLFKLCKKGSCFFLCFGFGFCCIFWEIGCMFRGPSLAKMLDIFWQTAVRHGECSLTFSRLERQVEKKKKNKNIADWQWAFEFLVG